MKKIDLGQTITILANIGVIAGIVFLGYELRQNNESLQAQSRYNYAMAIADYFASTAADSEVSYILVKAQQGETLSEHEDFRLWNHYLYMLYLWQWEYQEELLGRIDAPEQAWIAMIGEAPGTHYPGMRAVWDDNQDLFSSDFLDMINQRLASPPE